MKTGHHGAPAGDTSPPTDNNARKYLTSNTLLDSGTEPTTIIKSNIRIDINRSASDTSDYPIKPFLKELLRELKNVAPTSLLLPIDEKATDGALSLESDIPTGNAITKYVGGFQDAPGRTNKTSKVVRLFVRISTPTPLRELKRNTGFYQWLKQGGYFMRTHGFTSSYDVASAGFISMMSPTIHRRDVVNEIIQAAWKDIDPAIEIHLVPNNIPYGKGDEKQQAPAVQIQVDRSHLTKVREKMIEIFETAKDSFPNDIYFVPSPANGTMSHDLYYQHVRIHHQHIVNLRSFPITNVGNLQADMTITEPDGTKRITTFESELLNSIKPGTTNEKLFYSIEPTKLSASEGRYLLVTHKDNIPDAEKFIDMVFHHLQNNTPETLANVTKDNQPIARANRIQTSPRFQTYATKLQGMIPTAINLTKPVHNAWKRRSQPTLMNLTDEEFPPLDPSKKPRISDSDTHPDSMSATATTETFTTVDLDEIERAQTQIKEELQNEIESLRKATEEMRAQLQQSLTQQLAQLEQRIERNTQQMIASLGESLQQAMLKMNEQADRGERLMQDFMSASKLHTDSILTSIQQQIDRLSNNNHVSPSPPRKQQKERQQVDGNLNPTASHTPRPQFGTNAVTGDAE
jgi:hypothetical protein